MARKKKIITLDKRGVQTRAGEKSSEVSRETQAAREEESRQRRTKEGRVKITAAKKRTGKAPIFLTSKKKKDTRGIIEKTLDIVSAPLSKPKTFFTKGPAAAGRAVVESREKIAAGDTGEAAKVIGTTLLSTGVAVALVGGASAIAAKGSAAGVVKAFRAIPGGGFARPAGTKIIPGFTKAAVGRAGKTLAGLDKAGILKLLTSKPVQFVSKNLGKIAIGSGIMTWLASDNIMSGASIFSRDVAGAVDRGEIDRATGLKEIEEQQEFVDTARSFVNVATMVNPLMWPFRNIVMTNAEGAQNAIGLHRERVENAPTAEERQAEASAQFGEQVDEGRARRREEDLANQAEDTLFFEAIRKRNKGQELTPEEIDALVARGAATE